MQAPSVYMKIFKFITFVRRSRREVFSRGKDDSSVRIAEVLYRFFSIKVDESIILTRRMHNIYIRLWSIIESRLSVIGW